MIPFRIVLRSDPATHAYREYDPAANAASVAFFYCKRFCAKKHYPCARFLQKNRGIREILSESLAVFRLGGVWGDREKEKYYNFYADVKPNLKMPHYIKERRAGNMRSPEQNGEWLKNMFVQNYMEKLFYFCLKKTGNSEEAEDLTSEIAINILASLEKGIFPENFSAWVWKIAYNRYSVWADRKNKRMQSFADADIGDYEIEDDRAGAAEELILSEDLSLMRRELAFISSDYRGIIVSYYIKDLPVRTIAQMLGLPEGTVKTKLFRARKILKEGMCMAREFGIKSYDPEEISFASTGSQNSGLPWKVVNRKIPNNILLQASNNPSTLEELSMELGIAVPYMEEEVGILLQATLLKKVGDKYITDFFIEDKECQRDIYGVLRQDSKERSGLINGIVCDVLSAFRALGIAGAHINDNTLRWLITLYTVDYCAENTSGYCIEWPEVRANGERWGFIGYEKVELPENLTMGHNGCRNADGSVTFWTYKIGDYGLWDQVGEPDLLTVVSLEAMLRNKRCVFDLTEQEKDMWSRINGRYAHSDGNGMVIPDIPVFRPGQMAQILEVIRSHENFEKVMQSYQNAFDRVVEVLGRYSHEILRKVLPFCASLALLETRLMTLHDNVERGILTVPEDSSKSVLGMALHMD